MAKIKSVTVDFEHKAITVRPYEGVEQRIAVNNIYPDLFKAQMDSIELSADSVKNVIAEREGKIDGNVMLSAEQKQSAKELVNTPEHIDYIRRGLKVKIAKDAARQQADVTVDTILGHFKKVLEEKGMA